MEKSEQFIEMLVDSLQEDTPEGHRIAFRAALYRLVNIVRREQLTAIDADLQRIEEITQSYTRRFR